MSDTLPDPERTMTRLEACSQALVACTMAYTYPSDIELLHGAIVSFSMASNGGDYIAVLAQVLENMIPPSTPADQAAAAARWYVVEYIVGEINTLRQQGAQPRIGIGQTGEPVDAIGRTPSSYTDQED